MEEKDYIIIPEKVVEDSNLSSTDKLVYGIILRLTRSNGYCWATNKYIADMLGFTTRTISESVRKLKVLGYINSGMNNDEKYKTFRKISIDNIENIFNDF